MSYRVIFCGSRSWCEPSKIEATMSQLLEEHPDLVVIHGDHRHGADLKITLRT